MSVTTNKTRPERRDDEVFVINADETSYDEIDWETERKAVSPTALTASRSAIAGTALFPFLSKKTGFASTTRRFCNLWKRDIPRPPKAAWLRPGGVHLEKQEYEKTVGVDKIGSNVVHDTGPD